METCEICGNITDHITWVKNCGVCDICLIDRQLIEDCYEIDQDRINVLESVMREFIKEWEKAPMVYSIAVADKSCQKFKQLLKR